MKYIAEKKIEKEKTKTKTKKKQEILEKKSVLTQGKWISIEKRKCIKVFGEFLPWTQ